MCSAWMAHKMRNEWQNFLRRQSTTSRKQSAKIEPDLGEKRESNSGVHWSTLRVAVGIAQKNENQERTIGCCAKVALSAFLSRSFNRSLAPSFHLSLAFVRVAIARVTHTALAGPSFFSSIIIVSFQRWKTGFKYRKTVCGATRMCFFSPSACDRLPFISVYNFSVSRTGWSYFACVVRREGARVARRYWFEGSTGVKSNAKAKENGAK